MFILNAWFILIQPGTSVIFSVLIFSVHVSITKSDVSQTDMIKNSFRIHSFLYNYKVLDKKVGAVLY